MAAVSPSSHLIHSHLLHTKPSSLFTLFSKPLLVSSYTTSPSKSIWQSHSHSTSSFYPRPPQLCHSLTHFSSLCSAHTLSPSVNSEDENEIEEEEGIEIEDIDDGDDEIELGNRDSEVGRTVDNGSPMDVIVQSSSPLKRSGVNLPSLTVKEKKELASYANSLGKKLKSQLVGKSGVTANVATSFIENLESNELLKIKIHRTCPGELEDVVKQLEEATGSVVVGQIGRTVIIYRPSLAKLKAEEKRRENRRIFVRKEAKLKPVLPNKVEAPRFSNRGRRGTSRV